MTSIEITITKPLTQKEIALYQSVYRKTSNLVAFVEKEERYLKQELKAIYDVIDPDDPRTEQGFRDYNDLRGRLRVVRAYLKQQRTIAKLFKKLSRTSQP